MRSAKRLLVIGADTRYGREVVMGIHAYCHSHGRWEYHLEGDNSHEAVERARTAIHNWKADGIIAHIQRDRVEKLVQNAGLPVVHVTGGRQLDLPTVISDSGLVGRMVARHFLDSGFRNFAFCAKTPEASSQFKCKGFAQELTDAGYECSVFTDIYVGRTEPGWVRNRRRLEQWLLSLKKPAAVMCIHDLHAQEVASACEHLGLRIPDDIAVTGSGNDQCLCLMCTPPLSSVDTNIQQIGYQAARLLHRLIAGHKPPDKPILISPRRLVVRQSSDIIAVEDTDVAAAMRFIRDHACESLHVKELVRQVPICRRTLEQRFLKLIGRTPKAEITRVQMERAKALLGETDLPVAAVAKQAGFAEQKLFSVAFHRAVRFTPTQYRRNYRLETGIPAVQVT